jgi:hypothetical protein
MYSPRGAHVRISEWGKKDVLDPILIEYVCDETRGQ